MLLLHYTNASISAKSVVDTYIKNIHDTHKVAANDSMSLFKGMLQWLAIYVIASK